MWDCMWCTWTSYGERQFFFWIELRFFLCQTAVRSPHFAKATTVDPMLLCLRVFIWSLLGFIYLTLWGFFAQHKYPTKKDKRSEETFPGNSYCVAAKVVSDYIVCDISWALRWVCMIVGVFLLFFVLADCVWFVQLTLCDGIKQ